MKIGTGLSGTAGAGQFFKVEVEVGPDDRITDVRFHTVDCLWASTIGGMLTSRVGRMSVSEARAFRESDLEALLGDLPKTHRVFLSRSIAALQQALANCQ